MSLRRKEAWIALGKKMSVADLEKFEEEVRERLEVEIVDAVREVNGREVDVVAKVNREMVATMAYIEGEIDATAQAMDYHPDGTLFVPVIKGAEEAKKKIMEIVNERINNKLDTDYGKKDLAITKDGAVLEVTEEVERKIKGFDEVDEMMFG